jgi:hypothetical protein
MSLTTGVLILRTHAPIALDDSVETTIERFQAEVMPRVCQALAE